MCHLVVACSGMVFLRARKRNRKVAYWVHAFHRPCIRRRLGLARHECGAYRTSMEPGGAMGATFVRVAMRCMAAARRRHGAPLARFARTEEHTSELQQLMSNSYAVFCWHKKQQQQ